MNFKYIMGSHATDLPPESENETDQRIQAEKSKKSIADSEFTSPSNLPLAYFNEKYE